MVLIQKCSELVILIQECNDFNTQMYKKCSDLAILIQECNDFNAFVMHFFTIFYYVFTIV